MEWVLLVALVAVAVVATFLLMTRASKQYESKRARRGGQAPERPCSTCGSFMEYEGIRELQQVEGKGPRDGEPEPFIVELYACPTCRKVEFFRPPVALE